MSQVLDPSKELRFTRSAQALLFSLLAGVFTSAFLTLLVVTFTIFSTEGDLEKLPFPLTLIWGCLLLSLSLWWLAFHCARHPYLLLSPIGVEIFPFWKPVKNFQLIEWGRVAVVEFTQTQLILHHSTEKKSGVILTLSPLNKKSRILLQKAMEGVMEQRNTHS